MAEKKEKKEKEEDKQEVPQKDLEKKETKKKKFVYKVEIPTQSRNYDNQKDAREWAIDLLNAGIFFIALKKEEIEE